MTSNVEVTCSLCSRGDVPRVKFTISNYLKHLQLFQVHQADFRVICGINGCQRSYTNMGTFQNHVYSVHYCKMVEETVNPQATGTDPEVQCNGTGDIVDHSDEISDFTDDGEDSNEGQATEDLLEHPNLKPLQHSSTLFLLGLKEKYKLTQVAIQGIIEGVSSLNQHQMSLLKAQVCPFSILAATTVT